MNQVFLTVSCSFWISSKCACCIVKKWSSVLLFNTLYTVSSTFLLRPSPEISMVHHFPLYQLLQIMSEGVGFNVALKNHEMQAIGSFLHTVAWKSCTKTCENRVPIFTQACNAVIGRCMQPITAALDLGALRNFHATFLPMHDSHATACVALCNAGNHAKVLTFVIVSDYTNIIFPYTNN